MTIVSKKTLEFVAERHDRIRENTLLDKAQMEAVAAMGEVTVIISSLVKVINTERSPKSKLTTARMFYNINETLAEVINMPPPPEGCPLCWGEGIEDGSECTHERQIKAAMICMALLKMVTVDSESVASEMTGPDEIEPEEDVE